MTLDEIQQRLSREIGSHTANRFGWDFRPNLLPIPELRSYEGEMLWTVLSERPDGYQIIFDPTMDEFGLAIGGVCVGLHGSFMDTLNAM